MSLQWGPSKLAVITSQVRFDLNIALFVARVAYRLVKQLLRNISVLDIGPPLYLKIRTSSKKKCWQWYGYDKIRFSAIISGVCIITVSFQCLGKYNQ